MSDIEHDTWERAKPEPPSSDLPFRLRQMAKSIYKDETSLVNILEEAATHIDEAAELKVALEKIATGRGSGLSDSENWSVCRSIAQAALDKLHSNRR